MAYNEQLATRIRDYFSGTSTLKDDSIVEKEMFGGLAFMIGGHMCVGATGERLMARVGPEEYDEALKDIHATIMDFTGKPLRGFLYVEPEALETDTGLHDWIKRCEHFVEQLPPKP